LIVSLPIKAFRIKDKMYTTNTRLLGFPLHVQKGKVIIRVIGEKEVK
jgi:hypothetical protein